MSDDKQNGATTIIVAIIGLIGTLGAALITAKLTNNQTKESTPILTPTSTPIIKTFKL